jgi:hypothetical protein
MKKVAFAILNKLLDEFSEKFGGKISQEKTDNCMPFPALDEALTKYQDPAEADKITKIQKDLEETKQARLPCPINNCRLLSRSTAATTRIPFSPSSPPPLNPHTLAPLLSRTVPPKGQFAIP